MATVRQDKSPGAPKRQVQTSQCLEIAKGTDLCDLDVQCEQDVTSARTNRDRRLEADILLSWGRGQQQMGKLQQARDRVERAQTIHRALRDERQVALASLTIANMRFRIGDRDAAVSLAASAIQELERLQDAKSVCDGLLIIGRMRQSRLEWDEAERSYRRALAGPAKCGAEYALAALFRWRDGDRGPLLGLLASHSAGTSSVPLELLLTHIRDAYAIGDAASALRYIESARERARENCRWGFLVEVEGELLSILANGGETTRALDLGAKTLEISERLGADDTTANLLAKLGSVHPTLNQYDVALSHYQRALELNQRLGRRAAASRVMFDIASAHIERTDYASATKYLDAIDAATYDTDLRMAVTRERARIDRVMGLFDEAAKGFIEARRLAQQLGQKPNEAAIMVDLGDLQLERCDIEGALKLFEEALAIAVAANRMGSANEIRGWIDTARKKKCKKKAP